MAPRVRQSSSNSTPSPAAVAGHLKRANVYRRAPGRGDVACARGHSGLPSRKGSVACSQVKNSDGTRESEWRRDPARHPPRLLSSAGSEPAAALERNLKLERGEPRAAVSEPKLPPPVQARRKRILEAESEAESGRGRFPSER